MDSIQSVVRVRFAPSPTGYLHIGGARTALFNWLFARHHDGAFVLRIEDTDAARSDVDMTEDILDALLWLGLDWDEGPNKDGPYGPYFQSERGDIYRQYAQQLLNEGKGYSCYCTDAELAQRREEALMSGKPPMYDGRCRELTDAQIRRFELEGRKPSLRFRVPEADVTVRDLVRGETTFSREVIGDFIVQRSSGEPSFHLANVVDDALMRITHVIRGEDHYSNTPRHLLLYDAFGFTPPNFAHISMILAPDRSKLSKRHGAVALSDYSNMGYLPEALVNYLALLGWSSPDGRELLTLDDLIENFSLDRVNKSGAIFDIEKLNFLNGQYLRTMPPDEFEEEVMNFFSDESFLNYKDLGSMLNLIQDSVTTLLDIPERCRIFTEAPLYSGEVRAELGSEEVLALLRTFEIELKKVESWDKNAQMGLFKEVSKKTGMKGRPLYHAIRMALTGSEEGPELVGILDVLGKDGTGERIHAALRELEKK